MIFMGTLCFFTKYLSYIDAFDGACINIDIP